MLFLNIIGGLSIAFRVSLLWRRTWFNKFQLGLVDTVNVKYFKKKIPTCVTLLNSPIVHCSYWLHKQTLRLNKRLLLQLSSSQRHSRRSLLAFLSIFHGGIIVFPPAIGLLRPYASADLSMRLSAAPPAAHMCRWPTGRRVWVRHLWDRSDR